MQSPIDFGDVVDPSTWPLEDLVIELPRRFQDSSFWGFFDRLREESPVHYSEESMFDSYWSTTRFSDIVGVDPDISERLRKWAAPHSVTERGAILIARAIKRMSIRARVEAVISRAIRAGRMRNRQRKGYVATERKSQHPPRKLELVAKVRHLHVNRCSMNRNRPMKLLSSPSQYRVTKAAA